MCCTYHSIATGRWSSLLDDALCNEVRKRSQLALSAGLLSPQCNTFHFVGRNCMLGECVPFQQCIRIHSF